MSPQIISSDTAIHPARYKVKLHGCEYDITRAQYTKYLDAGFLVEKKRTPKIAVAVIADRFEGYIDQVTQTMRLNVPADIAEKSEVSSYVAWHLRCRLGDLIQLISGVVGDARVSA